MTVVRLLSPAARSSLMIAVGSALLALPFVLDLGAAALVVGVLAGVLALALGFAGTASGERGTISLSAQAAGDRGLALGLLLAGGVFGVAGQEPALALFTTAGAAALVVSGFTRYAAAI